MGFLAKVSGSSYGNVNDLIVVTSPQGKTYEAIALTNVTANDVFVFEENGQFYAIATESAQRLLNSKSTNRYQEKEIEQIEVIVYPFQVLLLTELIGLGGDRSLTTLLGIAVEQIIGGITNTGSGNYLSTWTNGTTIYRNNSGTLTIAAVPPGLETPLTDYNYFGNGIIGTKVLTEKKPELDPELSLFGDLFPPDVNTPLYPFFAEKVQAIRDGGRIQTQESDGYSYRKAEEWSYSNQVTGESDRPIPPPIDAICNPISEGVTITQSYFRVSKYSYASTITETRASPASIFWNEQVFNTTRQENLIETYTQKRPLTIFQTSFGYFCKSESGLYRFVRTNTNSSYSGETTIFKRDRTFTITQKLETPIGIIDKDNYTEILDETDEYSIPGKTWTIPEGIFFFNFESLGIRLITHRNSFERDRLEVCPLFIANNNTAIIYQTLTFKKDSQVRRDAEIIASKFGSDDSLIATNRISDLEVETVVQLDKTSYYYNETELNLADSFAIACDKNSIFPDDVFSNQDADIPILTAPTKFYTEYTRTLDRQLFVTSFSDEVAEDNPLFINLIGSSIELRTGDRLYSGTITNYTFRDLTTTESPVVNREILTIEVNLSLVSGGNADIGTVIYSQGNLTALVTDVLLEDRLRTFANLVNGSIYFSKLDNLNLTTQVAEVYQLQQDKFVRLGDVRGEFLPPGRAGLSLGINYFPPTS